jgi:hypothetical protein
MIKEEKQTEIKTTKLKQPQNFIVILICIYLVISKVDYHPKCLYLVASFFIIGLQKIFAYLEH